MMLQHKYSIGLDFGTAGARAVIVDNLTGEEVAEYTEPYPYGVLEHLPENGQALPDEYALHHPLSYLETLPKLLCRIVDIAPVSKNDITGIGVDATASTVVPLDENDSPLCFRAAYQDDPHAWIKLWKHHGAQPQAERINAIAKERREPFLDYCGGKVSAEWLWPKILETLEKSPQTYAAAGSFVELGDWLVYLLTGEKKRSSSIASVHSQWSGESGYPSEEFLRAVDPRLSAGKLDPWPVYPALGRAGTLSPRIAEMTGLRPDTAVAMANTDSPVSLLSLGAVHENTAVLILGTSSVFFAMSKEKKYIPGAMFSAQNLLVPGLYCNMFGQSAVGDIFEWFVSNLLPYSYYLDAKSKGLDCYQYMNRRMAGLDPQNVGVVALDWHNGCRSLLQDAKLSGVIMGLRLSTNAGQIYRALVESTAFGLRAIMDAVQKSGIKISKIAACGGIAKKSPEIMEIYADCLEMPIETVKSNQEIAHGSAIMGALAARSEKGGYDDVIQAIQAMKCPSDRLYSPNPSRYPAYRQRYQAYCDMLRHFGEDSRDIMRELR